MTNQTIAEAQRLLDAIGGVEHPQHWRVYTDEYGDSSLVLSQGDIAICRVHGGTPSSAPRLGEFIAASPVLVHDLLQQLSQVQQEHDEAKRERAIAERSVEEMREQRDSFRWNADDATKAENARLQQRITELEARSDV